MMKKIIFAACLMVVSLWPVAEAMAKPKTIYFVLWRGCEDACMGLQDYFQERGLDVHFVIRNANRDKKALPGFVKEAMELKPDLVVTWGTSVSRGIIGSYDSPDPDRHIQDIPALFMIVADPIGAKLIHEYDKSGRELVTGTHNRVPEDVQIRAIRNYLKADRIGLAFNPDELNSVLNAEKLEKLSQTMGFELIQKSVKLDAEGKPVKESLVAIVKEFADEKVDVIYVGSSSFITSNRDVLTQAAIDARIPVAAGSGVIVRRSKGLMAVANRYYNIGQLAGFQAEEILFKDKRPIDVPVRSLSRYSFIINMETARELELYPPIQLLRFADLVNKTNE